MKKIQKTVQQFNKDYNLENKAEFVVLDLVSEVGEVAKEILKSSDYGKKEPKYKEELKDEIGDVFYSLTVLANFYDISLKEALNGSLKKYKKRFKKKGEVGSKQRQK